MVVKRVFFVMFNLKFQIKKGKFDSRVEVSACATHISVKPLQRGSLGINSGVITPQDCVNAEQAFKHYF